MARTHVEGILHPLLLLFGFDGRLILGQRLLVLRFGGKR